MQRKIAYLNPGKKLVEETADWLSDRVIDDASGAKSLARFCVVVPTAQSGRNLRLALAKRFDFGGLRTAGSAFKNPPGQFAGALLEAAGCKGMRIGGAHVLDRHANIVAADDGATASDIMALLETMRARVASHSGVDLAMEIRQW